MKITHHPDEATLMSFAAGSLAEPLAAIVATHMSLCPSCRRDVAMLDMLGSCLVDTLDATPLEKPAPDAGTLRSQTEAAGADTAKSSRDAAAFRDLDDLSGNVPEPLVRLVGPSLDNIAWKRLGYGIWHYPLPLSMSGKGDLRLFKVAPGQVMPEHGHGGAEMTLLLRGSYSDEFGRFGPGDVADLDEDAEHQPIADPEVGCICLIASVERAKFKSLLARIVQPFTGL
ncbi:MAG: ChrR family anti-sigma-E factor [Hyphomicrobiaceae bacterium]|nr:ChrR family anti-sigma-E factor [Hyphomicrobiaceae bacterium]